MQILHFFGKQNCLETYHNMLSLLHLKKQTCLNSSCLFYCLLSHKAMLLSRDLYFHLPIHLQNYDSLASIAMTPSRPPTSWSCLIQETLRIQNVFHCPLAPWNSFPVFCDTTRYGFHSPSWLFSHPTDHTSSVFITDPSSALLVNLSVPQRSINSLFFLNFHTFLLVSSNRSTTSTTSHGIFFPLVLFHALMHLGHIFKTSSTHCWIQWMHTKYLLKNE